MSEVVRCPKCNAAVSVTAEQAGQRLQCPSCLGQFVAPTSAVGSGAASSEDDDWLTLDDAVPLAPQASAAQAASAPQPPASPPAPATTQQPASPPASPNASQPVSPNASPPVSPNASPPVSPNASQTGDLDPFVTESPASPEDDLINIDLSTDADPSSAAKSEDLFAKMPSVDPSAAPTGGANAGVGQAADESFRVRCPVCGSILYAKPNQTGKLIKCSDCFSEVKVPQPPRKKKPVETQAEAATFQLSDTAATRPDDPYKKSADQLLKEAEVDPDDELKPAYDAPSTIGWFKTVFGIFTDLGVILHFVGLSVLLAAPAALTYAIPVMALGMFPLALLGTTLTVVCAFAILHGVANEHERIEEWPTVDPAGWFDVLGLVIVATAIAVGPAYIVAKIVGAGPVLTIAMIMLSVYAAFPFILLSMLDMESVTSPFSPDVGKSVTRCQEDWGAFYFSSGLLFAGLLMYFFSASYTPGSVAVGVVLSIAVIFLYFAMLGRLAQAIGHVVEFTALEEEEEDDEEEE